MLNRGAIILLKNNYKIYKVIFVARGVDQLFISQNYTRTVFNITSNGRSVFKHDTSNHLVSTIYKINILRNINCILIDSILIPV